MIEIYQLEAAIPLMLVMWFIPFHFALPIMVRQIRLARRLGREVKEREARSLARRIAREAARVIVDPPYNADHVQLIDMKEIREYQDAYNNVNQSEVA